MATNDGFFAVIGNMIDGIFSAIRNTFDLVRNAVVNIVTTYADPTDPSKMIATGGSGVLIDPNTIVTAEHVLEQNRQPPLSVYVYSIDREWSIKLGPEAISYNVPLSEWRTGNTSTQAQSGQDYSTISLRFPWGTKLGWMEPDSGYYAGMAYASGYPGQSYEMLTGSYVDSKLNTSVFDGITPPVLRGGFSGGPVWTYENNEPHLVGILSAGVSDFARLVDISPETKAKLENQARADDFLVAEEVNRAYITKIFKICLGREPTLSELFTWAPRLASDLPLSEAYKLAVTLPEVQLRLLYDTLFDRPPTNIEVNQWLGKMKVGASLHDVGDSLLKSLVIPDTPGMQREEEFVDWVSGNFLGYGMNEQDRGYWVNLTKEVGELKILDMISTPEVNVYHIGIMGSPNPLSAGVFTG